MPFKTHVFSKTAVRILPALLLLAILLLTGCPPASETQAYNIKCTLVEAEASPLNYEFYKGVIFSDDPAVTTQVENGTIPVCSWTTGDNYYYLKGSAGPHAPLDEAGDFEFPFSSIEIRIGQQEGNYVISYMHFWEMENEETDNYWLLFGSSPPELTVIEVPENVGDIFKATFTAPVRESHDQSRTAVLSGSFYLKRMANNLSEVL